jgi:hypothetical protein
VYRTRTEGGNGWEAWQALGGPVAGGGVAGNPALVRAGDGRLALLARGSDGFAHVNRQLIEYGAWSGWSRVGTRAISTDVAAVAVGSTIHAFARDAVTERIWTANGDIESPVFSETVLDGPTILDSSPVAALDATGELRLVVVGAGHNLHGNRCRPGEAWEGWNALPRQRVRGRPALLPLGDGRMEIYATASRGRELVQVGELASWAAVP